MIPFLLICHCTWSSFSDNQRNNIENFETFQIKIIYTAYPDDTTFFLKNAEFVINLLEIFEHFLHFPSKSKCETADIPANIYLFKLNSRNTRKSCEKSSKLTIKTPRIKKLERRHWPNSISFLLTLNMFLTFL